MEFGFNCTHVKPFTMAGFLTQYFRHIENILRGENYDNNVEVSSCRLTGLQK